MEGLWNEGFRHETRLHPQVRLLGCALGKWATLISTVCIFLSVRLAKMNEGLNEAHFSKPLEWDGWLLLDRSIDVPVQQDALDRD
jgi:hypothetical protein